MIGKFYLLYNGIFVFLNADSYMLLIFQLWSFL